MLRLKFALSSSVSTQAHFILNRGDRLDSDTPLSAPYKGLKIMYCLTDDNASAINSLDSQPVEVVKENSLYTLPLFKGLAESVVNSVIARAITFDHPAKHTIVLEKDCTVSSVYLILNGWLKIGIFDTDGQEIILNIVGRGEIFGEMAALDVSPRSTDVTTLTPATIASIPSTDFLQLLRMEPEAGIRLAKLMANRLRQANRFVRLRQLHARLRVVDILLFLGEVQGQNDTEEVITPHFSHQELANLSGLTRELKQLEKQKLIQRVQNSMYIPDKRALISLLQ